MIEPKNKQEIFLQSLLSAMQTITEEIRGLRKDLAELKRETKPTETARKTVMK